ncbi:MAG TPA: amidohydrolase family protein [Candidatus Binatia bacterium]
MSWNGHKVIDMDTHVYERPDRMYREFLDPAYQEPYEQLCAAIEKQAENGLSFSLFGTRHAVIEPFEAGRPLGVRDSFGLSRQRGSGKRILREKEAARETQLIRPEVSWDAQARLEDMDRGAIDVNVIYATYVSSYCALRNVGFESALYRAYHRWVSNFCSQGKNRLKWTVFANLRDLQAGMAEVKYWAERDANLVGIYTPQVGPGGKLLDNPDFHPLYQLAQDLDLPLLVHPGTGRPPYTPGSFDMDGSWFLIQSLLNPWAGMTAMACLIGGGVFDLFPKLRAAVVETSAGWVPVMVDRMDSHYYASPNHVPNLKRTPRETVEDGRYAHAVDTWESTIEHSVAAMGEDLWLFATDYPHKGTQWPNAVSQIVELPGLSESAKTKILGANAMRVCPRLRD